MITIRRLLILAAFIITALVVPVGIAMAAQQTPTTGQPGASNGVTCFSSPSTANAPGNSMNAGGSVFNPGGTAGMHYAGNPGTASLQHSNSTAAVSQYDVGCLRVTTNH
jgi:hypothetical protein